MQKFVLQQRNGKWSKANHQNPQHFVLEESIGLVGLPCAVPPSTAVETSWRIQRIALKRARVDRNKCVINKGNAICCSQWWMKRREDAWYSFIRRRFGFRSCSIRWLEQATTTSHKNATFEKHMQKCILQQGNGKCSKANFQNPQRSFLKKALVFLVCHAQLPPTTAVETSWRIQMIAFKRARVDRKDCNQQGQRNMLFTIMNGTTWECVMHIFQAKFRFPKLFHQAVGPRNHDIA